MPELKKDELSALRETLEKLVGDLEQTVRGLSDKERARYEEAERSVVEARRKAETHEGLLQLN